MKRVFSIFSSKRWSFRRREGFTIVELIVAITVVSLFAGVVGVSVDQINRDTRLNNAASRALADIRYAQEVAMAHRREVDVYVTSSTDKYEIKWHDTGAYVPSSLNSEGAIVQFNTGEYSDVSITSSGLGGRLSFTSTGEPLINGSSVGSTTSAMLLNSKVHVVIYPSGYSCLEQVVGSGSGCGV